MKEITYVLTNPAMPGMVKIGRTTDLARRLRELNSSGVPQPFRVYCWVEVDVAMQLEAKLHRVLAPYRVNRRREFFRVEAGRVREVLGLMK